MTLSRVRSFGPKKKAVIAACAALPLIASTAPEPTREVATNVSESSADQPVQIPDSALAKATIKQVRRSLQEETTPDVEGLARVAAITLDAIARGDAKGLHQFARSRGMVIPQSRIDNLRAIIKSRPADAVPPDADEMTDDEVVVEVNKFVKPMSRAAASSVNAMRAKDAAGYSGLDAFMQPPADRTELRRKYAGLSTTIWSFSFEPNKDAADEQPGSVPVAVVEFEGECDRGKVLVMVSFYYNPTTGWLPASTLHCGALMARLI